MWNGGSSRRSKIKGLAVNWQQRTRNERHGTQYLRINFGRCDHSSLNGVACRTIAVVYVQRARAPLLCRMRQVKMMMMMTTTVGERDTIPVWSSARKKMVAAALPLYAACRMRNGFSRSQVSVLVCECVCLRVKRRWWVDDRRRMLHDLAVYHYQKTNHFCAVSGVAGNLPFSEGLEDETDFFHSIQTEADVV